MIPCSGLNNKLVDLTIDITKYEYVCTSLYLAVVEAQHNNMIKVKLFQFNCFSLASSHFLADDCHA